MRNESSSSLVPLIRATSFFQLSKPYTLERGIMHLHPHFSKPITPNRRLATAMKYLASLQNIERLKTYLTYQLPLCVTYFKEMCDAIRNKMTSAISFPSGGKVIKSCNEEWVFPYSPRMRDRANYDDRKGYPALSWRPPW